MKVKTQQRCANHLGGTNSIFNSCLLLKRKRALNSIVFYFFFFACTGRVFISIFFFLLVQILIHILMHILNIQQSQGGNIKCGLRQSNKPVLLVANLTTNQLLPRYCNDRSCKKLKIKPPTLLTFCLHMMTTSLFATYEQKPESQRNWKSSEIIWV